MIEWIAIALVIIVAVAVMAYGLLLDLRRKTEYQKYVRRVKRECSNSEEAQK